MNEIMHIYTRVSTTTQEEEGTSLETQKELGIKSAKKKGFDYRIWNSPCFFLVRRFIAHEGRRSSIFHFGLGEFSACAGRV